MMNFKPKTKAEKIVDEVFELIDDQYLYNRINQPIEEAFLSFEFDTKALVTHHTFQRVTSNFVRHIYKEGLGIQQIMSNSQAHSKLVAILEQGYQNLEEKGYDAAFLDSINPELNGLVIVLRQMADLITSAIYTKHIRWVYATRISQLEWTTRILIVEILLERWEPFLPPTILGCSPAQLADHLPQLMNNLNSINTSINKIMGGNFFEF